MKNSELRASYNLFYLTLRSLCYRDLLLKYQGAYLGIFWTLLKPWTGVLVFHLLYQNIIRIKIDYTPFFIFTYSGLIFWNFFSSSISECSHYLWSNPTVIYRTPAPVVAISITPLVSNGLELMIHFMLLILLVFSFGDPHSFRLEWMVLALFTLLLMTCVLCLLLSYLCFYFKDLMFLLPFLFQLGFILSPIGYPSLMWPENMKWLLNLNPLVLPLDMLRFSIFPDHPSPDIYFFHFLIPLLIMSLFFLLIKRLRNL